MSREGLMLPTRHRARLGLAAGVLLLVGAACGGEATPPAAGVRAPITISAVLTAAQQATIAGMSVEVTGPGIATPIIATLNVAGASVNGTVQVPVGSSRTFTVRAFDAQGRETYSGSATAAVVAGTNPPLTVRMAALEGSVPINVTIGTYGVTLTPSTASVAVNGEVTLTANATTDGASAPGPLTWGVVNPALVTLTVASDGRSAVVRGRIVGSTRVVASYEGVAAASTVTVTGAPATNQLPFVSSINAPGLIYVGTPATFTVSASDPDGTIVEYRWSFSNAGQFTTTTPSLQMTFSAPGTFAVAVMVVDNQGAPSASPSRSTTFSVQPAPPPAGFAATKVVTGTSHTCALTSAGAAYCWGSNADGRLGNGGNTAGSVQGLHQRPVPVLMPGGVAFAQLYAGGDHTCGVTAGGAAYCWGDNTHGQLGTGDTQDRDRPTPVLSGLSLGTMGQYTSCGFYNGTRACWGRNSAGEVTGTAGADAVTPVLLPPAAGVTHLAMVAGGVFTCFYEQSTPPGGTTQRFVNCKGSGVFDLTMNQGTAIASLYAGSRYACYTLVNAGGMTCWGSNSSGQFGVGSAGNPAGPVSLGLYTITAFGAGHSCGTYNGIASCAGDNLTAQLGNGTAGNPSYTPTTIAGGSIGGLAAGSNHSCGIRGGNVYCWGQNGQAALGDGTFTQRTVPTAVLSPAQ